MTTTSLAAYGYPVKPQAAKSLIWHASAVPHPLQLIFAKRLKEELEARQLSANGLAKAAKARGFTLGQRSVSRILELKQDPTLQKVHEISQTLDIPVRSLIGESEILNKSLQNVVVLPPPYPKIFGKKSQQGKITNGNIKKVPSKK